MAANLVKCSKCNIVINEVLAFVNNKLDVMDEESISRICISAFSENDIVEAKNLLFESIPAATKEKKTRRGDGKSLRNIDDIICTLKETDPEEIPIFVARELQKLPPILFDHVDVTKILKDLVIIQQDISVIKQQYAMTEQLEKLQCEFDMLKQTSLVNNYGYNVNNRRGACLTESFDGDGDQVRHPMGDISTSTMHNTITSSPETVYREIVHDNFLSEGSSTAMSNTNAQPLLSEYSEINDANKCKTEPHSNSNKVQNSVKANNVAISTSQPTANTVSHASQLIEDEVAYISKHTDCMISATSVNTKKTMADIVKEGEWKKETEGNEWIQAQRRRHRNRFAVNRGKAEVDTNVKFKAAEIKVPIYIYNVAKDVTLCDITKYVTSKSKLNVTVEQMSMKVDKQYNSYKIFVPKENLELFLQDDFWPVGIAYRRFVNFGYKNKRTSALRASEHNGINT